MEADLLSRLEALEKESLRRTLRLVTSAQGPEIEWAERRLLNFSSNDYLGLATERCLLDAARRALDQYGVGAGASRLVCGTLAPHADLESALVAWKRVEAALVFSSGYAAAVGGISALVGADDVVILDKLSHASLIDGARLSGAKLRVFPHNNLERLESHLKWARAHYPKARVLVVTESVFSMDGDRSSLREIVDLKERYDAWLMVDEAHAVGLFGRKGCGLVDAEGLQGRVEIQMGTLSKALGGSGGYLCGSRALVDWLVNKARSFVYSTAPSPVVAAVGAAAVRWMETEEASERRARLRSNVERLVKNTAGVFTEAQSAILPIKFGGAERALRASAALLEAGFWVPAIRYPTVAKGTERLRVTVSAVHSEVALDALGQAVLGVREGGSEAN
ncbi:MAG: 8-amino-7-oxononanoate synthase [Verrucomicrobiota bacterium]